MKIEEVESTPQQGHAQPQQQQQNPQQLLLLQNISCCVCLEPFKNPVSFPSCGHHVCKSHILDLATFHEKNDEELCPKGVARADRFFVRCPKCRCEEEVVDGVDSHFKVNSEMQSLVQAVVMSLSLMNANNNNVVEKKKPTAQKKSIAHREDDDQNDEVASNSAVSSTSAASTTTG